VTTDLSRLNRAVTKDSANTLLEGEIRKRLAEIRSAFDKGEDFNLPTKDGTLRIRKTA